MGGCMSIGETALRIECGPEVRARRREKKRRVREILNAEEGALQLLSQMPGRICTNGASSASCIFTKQGRKGINQDCMLVWEEFPALANTVLCAVFDGHGPQGHIVARKVRDSLPLLLALPSNADFCPVDNGRNGIPTVEKDDGNKESMDRSSITESEVLAAWKENFVRAYEIMDHNLKTHPKVDSICSGTTAVTMVVQDKDLVVGNVGDSRAVLGTRAGDGALVADQLTVDLKPNLPGELQRIRRCKGRVFALEDEPGVARVWQPHEDTPGLAMARALGDFCIKEYGLSAIPEVSYRRLTQEDEFIVLATDGVWDVLSNDDVVGIVSFAFPNETAAERVVEAAVKKWKRKHAVASRDDCTVACYFLKAKLTPAVETTDSVVSKSVAKATMGMVDYSGPPCSVTTTMQHLQGEICQQNMGVAL